MVIAVSRYKEREACPHACRIMGLVSSAIVTAEQTISRMPLSSLTRKILLPCGVHVAKASTLRATVLCCDGSLLHQTGSTRSYQDANAENILPKLRHGPSGQHWLCRYPSDPHQSFSATCHFNFETVLKQPMRVPIKPETILKNR